MNYFRISTGLLTIGATGVLLASSTVAFFTDEGTSSSNIFGAGTINLKLTDSDETDQDSVSGTWSAPNLKPGGMGGTVMGSLTLRNTGSVKANGIVFNFTNTITESDTLPGSVDTIPLDTIFSLEILTWDENADGINPIDLKMRYVKTDLNGNGYIDLDDLENTVIPITDFTDPQAGDHVLYFRALLRPDTAVNQHQGDSMTMTITATLSQETPP